MGLSTVNAPTGGGACQNSVTRAATRRRVNFSAGPEIGVCGRVGRYFPTRLPPEGRSEGGALVGVLFGWNGGRRKISPIKVVGGKVFRRWSGFVKTVARSECDTVFGWVVGIDHAAKP